MKHTKMKMTRGKPGQYYVTGYGYTKPVRGKSL